MKLSRVFLVTLAVLGLPPAAKAQTLVDSVNAGASLDPAGWSADDVGWLFTPSTSYTVGNIQTKFGSGGQIVTVAVYTNVPSSGGTLLASGSFLAQGNAFTGANLNTPLQFNSGQAYFVAFQGVSGLSVNVTSDGGATSLGTLYYDFGDLSYSGQEVGDFTTQPLLEFFGAGTQFAATPNLTPNQQAVAAFLDQNSVSPGINLGNVITALLSLPASGLAGALSELSPQAFGQFTSTTAFNNASFETQAMDNYLAGQRSPTGDFLAGNGNIDASSLTINDPSYDPNLAMIHSRMLAWNPAPMSGVISDIANPLLGGLDMRDDKNMRASSSYANPWNFFVRGNVVLAQGFSSQNVSHFDDNSESVVLGADYRITPHFLVGLTAGYGHTDATLDNDGSSATVDSYSPGLYASYADKGWYANLSGNYTHNAYTQDRVIGFLGQTANSAPEGNEGVANLDGGYDFHRGALTFGPLVGLQYTHLSVDGYNETGSIADLSVDGQDSDSLRSRLGGRISYVFSHCGMSFTPHLDASWQHEFLDQSRGITSQFNGGMGSFNVRTDSPSRDSALIDAGLDADINRTVTVFADYEVQAGQENYFGQSVQGGLKIGF